MNGQCLEFAKLRDGRLEITLTDYGREGIQDLTDNRSLDDSQVLWELMEYQLCNGWTIVRPEEIGAITDCDIIITDDIEFSDDGWSVTAVGRVYWDAGYATESPIKRLRAGRLVLTASID